MTEVSKLVALADQLKVGSLAQPPYCADPARALAEVVDEATRNSFDLLPVRTGHRPITRMISRAALESLNDWSQLADLVMPLTADVLVSADAPALSVLDRLDRHSVLFTLGAAGVEGVITIYDLNEPSAHLLGFGLVLVCEEALTAWIRPHLGSDADQAAAKIRALKAVGSGFRRWKRLRDADRHGDLATALTLWEKIRVIEGLGPAELAQRIGIESTDLLPRLERVRELRNAIGHYDEESLADPTWVHTRMVETRDLARSLAV
ncbi:MAG TPA: hypothetical protein VME22_00035 [Solirubrobacteraceae bacterium]|nr:hypothetical protein [Solirubrobacteraceae bacterium]